ncbi:hypothetical protein BH10PAT3_BH10PAT3_8050 [soil metagenome]
MFMPKLKISQHEHSGRLRPHEHTSYIPLVLMVFLVGVMLVMFSVKAFVLADSPGPQAYSIGLSGAVPAAPPKLAATITTPKSNQHFGILPVSVAGTCPTGTLVEVYKNNIFAGSTPCDSSGAYSVDIDLLYGQNILTAQVYDALNQAGPVSSPVTVFYDAVQPAAASLSFLNFGGTQLLLESDAVYRGTFPGQSLNVPITIIGGNAPFAINIQWGDSTNKIIPRGDNSIFNASHVYKKPGTYKITIQATDGQQQVAFLAVAAIVNRQPAVIAGTSDSQGSKSLLNKLLVLWPLYAIAATMVISFWVGEQREKRVLSRIAAQTPVLGATPHLSL